MNNSETTRLGTARQSAHPNGTPRYYSDPNVEDIIGVAGEQAFANRYGIKIDESIRPDGDNHIDFKLQYVDGFDVKQLTIDVKTAKKPFNLLIKDWEIDKCADILILAKYNDDKSVELLGWEYKSIMKKQPTKVFSSLGINNYYKSREQLRPMSELDKIMKHMSQVEFE